MTKRNLAFVVALATLGAAWTYPAAAQESDAAVPAAAGEPAAAETPAAQDIVRTRSSAACAGSSSALG